jgi:hypothetical protein
MSSQPQEPQEAQETFTTAFHTPFDIFNDEIKQEMSRLYSQIFAVLVTSGYPYLTTIVWMNSEEGFQKIYMESETGEDVYKKIFDQFGVAYN